MEDFLFGFVFFVLVKISEIVQILPIAPETRNRNRKQLTNYNLQHHLQLIQQASPNSTPTPKIPNANAKSR